MISKEFFAALEALEQDKKIPKEVFIETLETALTSAYKKDFGEANSARVKLDFDKKTIKIYRFKTVVEEVEDSDKQISLADAKKVKKSIKLGDKLEEEVSPKEIGRIATGTAKQVVMQKIREIEKNQTLEILGEKEGKLLSTLVRRTDGKNVFVELGTTLVEGFLGEKDQIPGEKYFQNSKIKVYVKRIVDSPKKGPLVLVSRTDPEFIKKLFEMEIPEIQNGDIEILNISREPGYRTKVAIKCNTDLVDPVGACIGNRGARINAIINEINGEKIDIVLYSENPQEFVVNALSPATVDKIVMIDEKTCQAFVPNNKLSLAIGKNGINVKLAAKLTNIRIDVKTSDNFDEIFSEKQQEDTFDFDSNLDENIDDLFIDEALDEE